MKVLIFGGTGLVGTAVTRRAVAAGHEVTVFTRNKQHVTIDGVTVVEGSVKNAEQVAQAVKGMDAVIQCIGIGGRGNGKPTTVASDANRVITQVMEQEGVKRYIAMSVVGAGDSWTALPWIYHRCLLPWFQSWFVPIIDYKNRMGQDIVKTGLDWTVVRSTTVKDKPARGRYKAITDGRHFSFSITAADLADFIVAQLNSHEYVRKMPVVCN